MKSFVLCLMLFLSTAVSVFGVSDQVETQPLYDHLFTNYTPNLLPRCGNGKTVTMRIDIALRQIIELNEPEQILTINVWMRLSWQDCRLTWNPVDFNNLTYVTVLYDDVWTPDITLYDSAASEDSMFPSIENYRAYISSSGSVSYVKPSYAQRLKTSMFPGRENYRAYISNSGSVSYNFPTLMISIRHIPVSVEINMDPDQHMVALNCHWSNISSAASEDSMFPGRENYRAYISSSGSVSYNFPTLMISICRVNVKYFPFDTQTCTLKFGSWSHHGFELDIESKNPTGDTDIFVVNSEWIIEGFPAERHELFYNCCPEPYPDVTYYVILKRRPLFYLMTMFFPCVLVTFVAGLTFVLPTESGEKISLEITVLLSLSVFLLLVSEALPPSSDNFPIIGTYFGMSMVLVSLSLVQTVVVVNLFHRGRTGRKVPRWVQIVFFQFLGRILCVHRPDVKRKAKKYEQNGDINDIENITTKLPNGNANTDIHQNMHSGIDTKITQNGVHQHKVHVTQDKTVSMLGEQLTVLRSIETLTRNAHDETDITEWKDVSNIVDRLFLVLFSLISIITTVIFTVQMMSGNVT